MTYDLLNVAIRQDRYLKGHAGELEDMMSFMIELDEW